MHGFLMWNFVEKNCCNHLPKTSSITTKHSNSILIPHVRRGLLDFMSASSPPSPPCPRPPRRPSRPSRPRPRPPLFLLPSARRVSWRTSTAIVCLQCSLSASNVPCRAANGPRPPTVLRGQCSLPDLNRDPPRPVFFAPGLNRDHPRPVFSAGPQPRSAASLPCRTSAQRRLSCDMADRIPQRMSEEVPERILGTMSEDMADRIPERMSKDARERLSERMSEEMTERMSEEMPERRPERVLEDVLGRLSERMPEEMPERMSGDARKNVRQNIRQDVRRFAR